MSLSFIFPTPTGHDVLSDSQNEDGAEIAALVSALKQFFCLEPTF
jgi:hypothetical protein